MAVSRSLNATREEEHPAGDVTSDRSTSMNPRTSNDDCDEYLSSDDVINRCHRLMKACVSLRCIFDKAKNTTTFSCVTCPLRMRGQLRCIQLTARECDEFRQEKRCHGDSWSFTLLPGSNILLMSRDGGILFKHAETTQSPYDDRSGGWVVRRSCRVISSQLNSYESIWKPINRIRPKCLVENVSLSYVYTAGPKIPFRKFGSFAFAVVFSYPSFTKILHFTSLRVSQGIDTSWHSTTPMIIFYHYYDYYYNRGKRSDAKTTNAQQALDEDSYS